MTVIRFFLIILAIYFLYRFIFDFVLPVYKASRKIHQQFRNMQQHTQENVNANQHAYRSSQANGHEAPPGKANAKDYIDFEEVKD